MAKFRFRLTALRQLREVHRDELRGKLAEAYQAASLLDEQVVNLENDLAQLQQQQRDALRDTATDVNGLLEMQRYQATLRSQHSTMQDQAKLLEAEVERRRAALVEADRQVRVLDKLEERQRFEHRQAAQYKEVKEMDEIAGRRGEVEARWAL